MLDLNAWSFSISDAGMLVVSFCSCFDMSLYFFDGPALWLVCCSPYSSSQYPYQQSLLDTSCPLSRVWGCPPCSGYELVVQWIGRRTVLCCSAWRDVQRLITFMAMSISSLMSPGHPIMILYVLAANLSLQRICLSIAVRIVTIQIRKIYMMVFDEIKKTLFQLINFQVIIFGKDSDFSQL